MNDNQMETTRTIVTASRQQQAELNRKWEEAGVGDDVLPELKNFLNLINGDAPADEFCAEVDQRVQEAKLDAETRRNFMEFEYMQMLAIKDANEKARREVREEALKEGREEGLEEAYSSLVQRGVLSIADAVKWSGLSEAQLRKRMK